MNQDDCPAAAPEKRPRPKRKALSAKTRFDVFKRDKFTCQYCGAHPPQVLLHVDHILAVANGGSNDEGNLVTACEPCNLGKGARSLGDARPNLKAQSERAADMEAQLLGYQALLLERRARIETEVDKADEQFGRFFPGRHFSPKFRISVRSFIERLGLVAVLDAIEASCIRCNEAQWASKYLCAICWRQIREQSE